MTLSKHFDTRLRGPPTRNWKGRREIKRFASRRAIASLIQDPSCTVPISWLAPIGPWLTLTYTLLHKRIAGVEAAPPAAPHGKSRGGVDHGQTEPSKRLSSIVTGGAVAAFRPCSSSARLPKYCQSDTLLDSSSITFI